MASTVLIIFRSKIGMSAGAYRAAASLWSHRGPSSGALLQVEHQLPQLPRRLCGPSTPHNPRVDTPDIQIHWDGAEQPPHRSRHVAAQSCSRCMQHANAEPTQGEEILLGEIVIRTAIYQVIENLAPPYELTHRRRF